MTKVTIETAVFIEAVRKAKNIAPTKGTSFDTCAGIIVEVEPDDGEVAVRATDELTYLTTWVKAQAIEGGAVSWRLPSGPFSQIVEKLRITGSVILEQVGRNLQLTSGRTRAEFTLMVMENYPRWTTFDEDDLIHVDNLGPALRHVAWAASSGKDGILDGVHLNGQYAITTNRFRVCQYPVKIDGLPEDGITLPRESAKAISDVKGVVKFGTDGHQAFFMPDDDTQIRTVLYGERFPRPKAVFDLEYPNTLTVAPQDFLRLIGLTNVMSQSDRSLPSLIFWIGKGQIAALATSEEIGKIRDIVDIPGQANHERVEIKINPKNLALALENGEGSAVVLHYNADITYVNLGSKSKDRIARVLKFTKDGGYCAWVIPITAG